MARLARTCGWVIVLAGGAASACGHLAFDELPSTDDPLTSDSGTYLDGSDPTQKDGGSTDGRPPIGDDDDDLRDGGLNDGSIVSDADPLPDAGRKAVYVSVVVGRDANPGTQQKPVGSISKGIERALDLGLHEVFVAAGTYSEAVMLKEGINLHAGYVCDKNACDWGIGPDLTYETIIANQTFDGVLAGDGITRATLMEGFTITGKTGALALPATFGGVGMTILHGSPTLVSMKITGGDTRGVGVLSIPKRSIGVVIAGPNLGGGPKISSSTIIAGPAADTSIGVLFENRQADAPSIANATIVDSTIRSGSGASSVAVYAMTSGDATLLEHNTIESAPAAVAGVGGNSWGLMLFAGGKISRNRINVSMLASATPYCSGAVQSYCGGILSNGSSASILSNFIGAVPSAKSVGVLLVPNLMNTLVTVNGNTIAGGGTTTGEGISTCIAVRAQEAGGTAASRTVGIVRNNIFVMGSNKARYGVYEERTLTAETHLFELSNNAFFPEGSANWHAYHSWTLPNNESDIAYKDLASTLSTPTPKSCTNEDPKLDTTWHLTIESKGMIDQGTADNLATKFDIDNDPRPLGAGTDIGADEFKK